MAAERTQLHRTQEAKIERENARTRERIDAGTRAPDALWIHVAEEDGDRRFTRADRAITASAHDGAIYPGPTPSSIFGLVTPGGILAIAGSYFGDETGVVRIKYEAYHGASLGALLEILEWRDGLVGVRIPEHLTGFRQQTATLEIESASHSVTSVPVVFHPILAYELLDRGRVENLACGGGSSLDSCALERSYDVTIWGFHQNNKGFSGIGSSEGVDRYRVSLANDWTIQSTSTVTTATSSDEHLSGPGTASGAHWEPAYDWYVSSGDRLHYKTFITVVGPRNVPLD